MLTEEEITILEGALSSELKEDLKSQGYLIEDLGSDLEYDPPYVQILSELAAAILRLKETIKGLEDCRTPETMGFLPLAEKKLGFRIGKEGEHWYPVASRILNLLAKSRQRDEKIKYLLGSIAFKSDLIQKELLEAMLDLNRIKEDIGREEFPLGRIPTLDPPLPSEDEDEENF